jgi:hypothetical protein
MLSVDSGLHKFSLTLCRQADHPMDTWRYKSSRGFLFICANRTMIVLVALESNRIRAD